MSSQSSEEEEVKWGVGFKGFAYDLTSKYTNFQFEIGETYEVKGNISLCQKGFHFCNELKDVFGYYDIWSNEQFRYCLIEYDPKNTVHDYNWPKSVTKRIKIVRELSEEEIREISEVKVWRNKKKELCCERLGLKEEDFKSSHIEYWGNENVKKKLWFKKMKMHREDGPAYIECWSDGNVHYEKWFKEGKKHREGDYPAYIIYHFDGDVWENRWYKDGVKHRKGGPAVIGYSRKLPSYSLSTNMLTSPNDEYGSVCFEKWYENGKLCRKNGPSSVRYNLRTGKAINVEKYEKG